MNNGNIIRECTLANSIKAVIHDVSSHYFGGYYHVRLQITAEVTLCKSWFSSASEYEDAIRRFGDAVSFKRTLEKMAVPATEVDSVKSELLESFDTNVLSYLLRHDFPSRFVLTEYHKVCKPNAVSAYYRQ